MNKNTIALFSILGIFIGVVISGCGLVGVTIEGRIQQLESDLNNSYSEIYKNWHSETATYQAGANSDVFNEMFPSSETYSITSISADSSAGTATATLNSTIQYSDQGMSFTMKKDGLFEWYIESLSMPGYIPLRSIE